MFYNDEKFINNFIKLIRECNDIILEIYNSDFNVDFKDDNSPLTMADKKCNDHICDYLNTLKIPNSYIISEENKTVSYQDRKNYEWIWLVDPLDGTKEFVKQNGQFTVNIGLCQNNVPVFGIVSIPVSGDIYYGVKNVGSFKITKGLKLNLKVNSGHYLDDNALSQKNKLQINKKDMVKKGLRIVASASHLNDKTKQFMNQYNEPEIVSTGSSIKLLWIAEGKADLYPRIAPTSEWDTCAAHAVVKYAGGYVLKYDDTFNIFDCYDSKYTKNNELEYNKENILNPYFIVY